MALDPNILPRLVGKTLRGTDGDLGRISELYTDDESGEPTFATVDTGMFGGRSSFVPLAGATTTGDDVTVPYDKEKVKNAPNIAEDGHIEPDEEQRLYEYYGIGGSGTQTSGTQTGGTQTSGTQTSGTRTSGTRTSGTDTAAFAAGTGTAGTGTASGGGRGDRDGDGVYDDVQGRAVGHDTSGPTTDDAMTRSEERLQVGTERREAGRARLRKFITSETQTQTVPVTREEVRVEREPITDANAAQAYDGPALSEEEHEVVLTEERATVDKETVPVERVRLDKDTVTEQQQVSEEVRKEQIEVEGDGTRDRGV